MEEQIIQGTDMGYSSGLQNRFIPQAPELSVNYFWSSSGDPDDRNNAFSLAGNDGVALSTPVRHYFYQARCSCGSAATAQ